MTEKLHHYFKDSMKFVEALEQLKQIIINRNSGKVYAIFRSSDNSTDYDVFIDIFNWKYSCSCKAFCYGKLCKHVRLTLFLSFFYDKLSMQYFRKASFDLMIVDKDYVYHYKFHKGHIIIGKLRKKFDVI